MITDEQYFSLVSAMTITKSVDKASKISRMHRNTARKYLRAKKPPSLLKTTPSKKNLKPVIQDCHWQEISALLEESPELEATAAMEYLKEKYPDHYTGKELRSLQRKFKYWKVLEAKKYKEVIFPQVYRPGEKSQSDFIHINPSTVTIKGQKFPHLLFHFTLTYSNWEYVKICQGGESFENLCAGFEESVHALGGVTLEHRTDNLKAAVTLSKKEKKFTQNWSQLCDHYSIKASTNNPGKSQENGKVERSNGLIQRSLENHLILRRSRDFQIFDDYKRFLENIVEKRNKGREEKFSKEKTRLQSLPKSYWYQALKLPVKVHSDSTIRLQGAIYSVPSRTIGATLFAYLYPDKIDVYYGTHFIERLPRFQKGDVCLNFLHVIESLRRKPGAFEDYKYKNSLYPNLIFRKAYDSLTQCQPITRNKTYIECLHFAKLYGVKEVSKILKDLMAQRIPLSSEDVRKGLSKKAKPSIEDVTVTKPDLKAYDALLKRSVG